ncbi:MAG: AmmeMemoRadiSam system radical SAM enzyme [Candidatus Aenigmarchaeota archaeon]|nr:AmmeMemoRadiSam system radical SAM enzyme [Candidatus Aenigmarchaeota archaeon]
MKEADFYKKLDKKKVQCVLCPRKCVISEEKTGFCGVRKNLGGTLRSLVYGKPCAVNIDPIEKKPLYHFRPGTVCLSLGTVGCNLDCSFCQNWDISHPKTIFGESLPPERVIEFCKQHNLPGIAYTYNEPTIWIEFALDTMKLAKKEGLYNVWVSNGYTNPEPIKELSKYLDAINVDLKGDVKFYKRLCGIPDEEPVKKALLIYKKAGVHIEVTNLLIPGFNDKPEQMERLVLWVAENLGKGTPLHFSRFFPHFRMKETPITPMETLKKAEEIAKKHGIKHVHLGNV